jgi:hypothetical protein
MQIQISREELAQKKLFIGMPTYGGMMTTLTAKSLIDLNSLMAQYGVEVKFSFLMNESLIQRARNYITDEFLNRSDCTHLMFIDADIVFNPQDIIAMLALDKEIVGGPYPKKSLDWNQLNKAIKKNPELPPSEYEKLTGSIVFNPVGGTTKFSIQEPLEIMDLGTGFMLIRRDVLEKYQAAYPEKMYKPDHVGQAHFDGSREICAFFDCVIDPDSKRYLSEDYFFTQQCRKIGIKTWLAPWINLGHMGSYLFQGSLPHVATHIGEL